MAKFVILPLLLFIGYVLSKTGIEHNLAGLPHWATSCPRDAGAILVIGQSQASNTGARRHISFSGSRAFADGKCYYLRDPMPGTAGRGGTIWPRFADGLGKHVVIANIAISGSAIEQWTVPEQLNKIRRALAELQAAGHRKPIIIWMQGETNGARRTSASAYYSEMQKLLQVAPRNPWLITRESICADIKKKWVPLDIARDQIAHDFPLVKIGPDLDKMGLTLRQPDQCHMSDEGQMVLATALSLAVRPMLARNYQ